MTSVVNVTIHSDISEFPTDKRYDKNIKISELKEKLELVTGANHKTMKVTMIGDQKEEVVLADDAHTLAYYIGDSVTRDTIVKLIVEDDEAKKLLQGDVPKYTMSEEKYQQRPNVREFIKQTREKQQAASNE